jgi:hypothetical protein
MVAEVQTMPVEVIDESSAPRNTRKSYIANTAEWAAIKDALGSGLAVGKVLKVTLSPETLAKFKNKEKAPLSFVQKLRLEPAYAQYLVRQIGAEIYISHKGTKK